MVAQWRQRPCGNKVIKSLVVCSLLGSSALTGVFAARLKGKDVPESGVIAAPDCLDFGDQKQGARPRGSFTLTNHYPFSIDITDIWTSCGCTVPSGYARHLNPKESTQVWVDWFLGSKRGKETDKITVLYSRPKEISSQPGLIPLWIQANVLPEIQVDPLSITFHRDQPGNATVRVSAGTRREFKVKSVYANVDFIKPKWCPESGTIECYFEPPLNRGRDLSGVQILIETESEVEKLIRVRVNVLSESNRGASPSKEF
jgi:Protein of unknown function (DUF1573)